MPSAPSAPPQVLPEREARAIMAQVFSGLAYLNAPQHRVIHYDLKPGNILLCRSGTIKITDFGLSKVRVRHWRGGATWDRAWSAAGVSFDLLLWRGAWADAGYPCAAVHVCGAVSCCSTQLRRLP